MKTNVKTKSNSIILLLTMYTASILTVVILAMTQSDYRDIFSGQMSMYDAYDTKEKAARYWSENPNNHIN